MSKTGDDGIPAKNVPPALRHRNNRRPVVIGAAAAVTFIAVSGSVYGLATAQSSGPGPTSSGGPPVSASPTSPPPVPEPVPTAGTPDEALTLTSSQARRQLQSLETDDATAVASLSGGWVPQVSSKCVGVPVDIEPDWTPDGTAETAHVTIQQILGFHLQLASEFGSLTTRPTAVGSVSDHGRSGPCEGRFIWMSLVPETFSTSDEANAWCDAHVPARPECLARLVSPGGGTRQAERT